MSHRVTVPSFGEHTDADDTAHISTRRVKWAANVLCQFLETLWINGPALAVLRPIGLSHRIKRQAHPGGLSAFRLLGICLVHHLGVHANGVHAPVLVKKALDIGRGNSGWWSIFSQPFVHNLGNLGVFTDEDKHRRSRVTAHPLPLLPKFCPEARKHRNRHIYPFENCLRLGASLLPTTFSRGELRE